jgi:hypothetical protein
MLLAVWHRGHYRNRAGKPQTKCAHRSHALRECPARPSGAASPQADALRQGLGPGTRLPENWYGRAGDDVDFWVVLFDTFV